MAEHNWLIKAKQQPRSRKTAIHAKCFECLGGTIDELPDGGWKNEIRKCTDQDCPLFPHRPYKASSNE